MELAVLDQAVELLEKANAGLEPELLSAPYARELLARYARAEKLAAFGVAALSSTLDDANELARLTSTSMGKAQATVATGKVMEKAPELGSALQHGDISLGQAQEIARAEDSQPGAAPELVARAQEESFFSLKDKARRIRLEAEHHKHLALCQRAARAARSHLDELGITSTSPWSPMSEPPSWPGPRQRPPGWRVPPSPRSHSSVISQTPTRPC